MRTRSSRHLHRAVILADANLDRFIDSVALFVSAYHRIRVPEYRAAAGKIERAGTVNTPVREYAN